ncbi:hypothetical protein [Altererythrobacter ishigakiensis]|uniref:DUF1648 domain-containing protein n=1 Tax=Altererythrobacter ishigakiensis TaxID=476157 RepID=A0A562UUQ4_9SPHN|nr:hypothetical protein [Altererythrobacter ishigakiensis]TWJ09372.1 hypothetical protein JN10_1004 [Altererythrobacter ishigakiensis]
MGGWLPLAITAGTVILLILSGAWANRRFADFEQLPGHYDFAGRGSRMTPRRTMVWLLPMMFSVMIGVYGAMAVFVPGAAGGLNELPWWLVFSAGCLLGAQALVLWLTDRWAKRQRDQS